MSHRYRLSLEGRRIAIFFNRVYARLLRPSLAILSPNAPSQRPMLVALRRPEQEIDGAINTLERRTFNLDLCHRDSSDQSS